MAVRDRLVLMVDKSGASQAEIARRVGEERDWLNRRLLGRTGIMAEDVCRLAAALDVPILAFYRDCYSADAMGEVYEAASRVFGLTPDQVKEGGFFMSVDEPAPMVAGKPRPPEKAVAPMVEAVRKAAKESVEEAFRELMREIPPEEPPAGPEQGHGEPEEKERRRSIAYSPEFRQAYRMRRLQQMARDWKNLPEELQELINELVEERKMDREREVSSDNP